MSAFNWNIWIESTIRSLKKVYRTNRSSGVDGESLEVYLENKSGHLERLKSELNSKKYKPRAVGYRLLPKSAHEVPRVVYSLTNRDYLVSKSIASYLKSLKEFGMRDAKGVMQEIDQKLVVDKVPLQAIGRVDIQHFFNALPYRKVMTRLRNDERINEDVLMVMHSLSGAVAGAGVEKAQRWWKSEKVAPQGVPYSPLIADWYIREVVQKHWLWPARPIVFRFVDDMIIAFPAGYSAVFVNFDLARIRWAFKGSGLKLHSMRGESQKSTLLWQGGGKRRFKFLGMNFELQESGVLKKSIPENIVKKEKTNLWQMFNRYFGRKDSLLTNKYSEEDLLNFLQYRILLRSAGCKYRGKSYGFANYWAVSTDPAAFKRLDNYVQKLAIKFQLPKSGVKSFYYRSYHRVKAADYHERFEINFDTLTREKRIKFLIKYFGVRKNYLNHMEKDELDAFWHKILRGEMSGMFGSGFSSGSE